MISLPAPLTHNGMHDCATALAAVDNPGPIAIVHVADHYNRYPAETVTFFTRLEIIEAVEDVTLRVFLPPEFNLENYWPPIEQPNLVPQLEASAEGHYLRWLLPGGQPAGVRYEYRTEVRIALLREDTFLSSQAVANTAATGIVAEASVRLAVRTKGKYLRYLPALYEQDDLMGRFLMIFESVWEPIRTQVGGTHHYLDPNLTPDYFLPWLATWLGIELNEKWDPTQLRQLLQHAMMLHRSRGTRHGLQRYLELYTGCRAEIQEGFENFVLGEETTLGPGLSLGGEDTPHSFTVSLKLPPEEADSLEEQKQREAVRRRSIEAIIEHQKPAHTTYTLNLEQGLHNSYE